MKAIDLKREAARLDQIDFAKERPRKAKVVVPAEKRAEPTGAYKTFEDAERLYKARDLEQAKAQYLLVLKQTEEKPLHAKAYYGLARVAALQNDPETAERLFQKTLECSPEPEVAAWAYVYLGRLADASGRRDQATWQYRSALSVQAGPRQRSRPPRRAWRRHLRELIRFRARAASARRSNKPDKRLRRKGMRNALLGGVLVLMAAGIPVVAQQAGQAAPAQPVGKARALKSPEEQKALQAVFQATTPDARIAASEDFITKFPKSDFLGLGLFAEAQSYQQKNDYTKMQIYGERTLEADPTTRPSSRLNSCWRR